MARTTLLCLLWVAGSGCTMPHMLDAGPVGDVLEPPADAPADVLGDAPATSDAPTIDAPTGFAACPPETIRVRHADGPWGREIRSSDYGRFGEGVTISFEIIPDRATAVRHSAWAYFTGGAPAREFSVTTTACDFSGATTLPGSYGGRSEGLSATPTFDWQAGTSLGGTTTMLVGQTYYINFRNEPGACVSGDCVLIGQMNY